MNTQTHSKKVNQTTEIIAGLLFLMFLVWGCIYQYQLRYPWTCQQAREAWQKKQPYYKDDPSLRQLNPAIANRDTIHLCK